MEEFSTARIRKSVSEMEIKGIKEAMLKIVAAQDAYGRVDFSDIKETEWFTRLDGTLDDPPIYVRLIGKLVATPANGSVDDYWGYQLKPDTPCLRFPDATLLIGGE